MLPSAAASIAAAAAEMTTAAADDNGTVSPTFDQRAAAAIAEINLPAVLWDRPLGPMSSRIRPAAYTLGTNASSSSGGPPASSSSSATSSTRTVVQRGLNREAFCCPQHHFDQVAVVAQDTTSGAATKVLPNVSVCQGLSEETTNRNSSGIMTRSASYRRRVFTAEVKKLQRST